MVDHTYGEYSTNQRNHAVEIISRCNIILDSLRCTNHGLDGSFFVLLHSTTRLVWSTLIFFVAHFFDKSGSFKGADFFKPSMPSQLRSRRS